MTERIKLGPIAVFLAIIAIILVMLSVLTISTAKADLALSERFAKVTQIKYSLDEKGDELIFRAEEAQKKGLVPVFSDDVAVNDDGTLTVVVEQDGYRLRMDIRIEDGNITVLRKMIEKQWNGDQDIDDLFTP